MKKTPEKTHDQYAAQYGVSRRTIIRWQKKGYPLDKPEEVRRLEASQKTNAKLRAEIAAVQVDARALTNEQLTNPPDLAHAMVYEHILRCRKLAGEVREIERQFISQEEVGIGQRRVNKAIETVLLDLSTMMPKELVGLEPAAIQQRMAAWVHAALTTLSDPHNPVYGA